MIRAILPLLYIEWYENLERHSLGPFWTISPSGSGIVLGKEWVVYKVQTPSLQFEYVTIPHKSHSIIAKNDILYDDGKKPGSWPAFPLMPCLNTILNSEGHQ